jgi:iron(III) transport system substrate-binding protein
VRAIGAIILTLALTPAAAWAQTGPHIEQPEAVIKAAQAEGAIMLYTSQNENLTRPMLSAFEKRYGIKGSFVRFPTAPLMQRFATEHDGKSVQADILSVASPLPFENHPDWFVPLTAQLAPNIANWPAAGLHKNRFTWTNEVVALAYNTEQIAEKDAPRTWKDVVDPKWKGKIMLSDPQAADNYMGWLDALERAHGVDYLRKLADQDFKLTPSGASGAQMVAAGAFAMNFPTVTTFSLPLIAKKAPIAVVYPTEPLLASARDTAVVAAAPHPNAARLYLNWLMSEEATRRICSLTPTSIVGDPDGRLGCVPTRGAQGLIYEHTEERRKMLTKALGIAK